MMNQRQVNVLNESTARNDYDEDGYSIVAVYGTLRTGCGNHVVMERAGGEYIRDERWYGLRMYASAGCGFPFVSVGDPDESVIVELYRVPNSGIMYLDNLEGHPNFYRRTYVDTSSHDAYPIFTYLVSPESMEGDEVYEAGDWMQFLAEGNRRWA